MHHELMQDLATILVVGSLFGWICKKFFQLPLILGYVFGGIIINLPFGFTPSVLNFNTVQELADIGILLLLFSMGLHFGIRHIKSLGFSTLFVGVFQALGMFFTGKYVSQSLGLNHMQSLFVGAAIAASATSVIIKTIEDLQLKNQRFAEKLTGVLLIEDSTAIFIIILLSATESSTGASTSLLPLLPIFIGSILVWWILGTILVPRLMHFAFLIGKEELLATLSIGLAMSLAYFSASLKFSPALGAFVMGSIISECRELRRIEYVIEPIKNIFTLVFFVSVGLLFSPQVLLIKTNLIFLLVLTIIFGKITYNLILNLISGRQLKDALRMSGSMAQVGEFSFIVAQLGKIFHVFDDNLFSTIIAVAVITMLLTPFFVKFFIYLSEKIEYILPSNLYKLLNNYSTYMSELSFSSPIDAVKNKIIGIGLIESFVNYVSEILRSLYKLGTTKNVSSTLDRLAPWDEYLVTIRVEYGSPLLAKHLIEMEFRDKFNLIVVAIIRDSQTIVSPGPMEIIMANDELLIYGNDQSISKLSEFCDKNRQLQSYVTIDDCILERLTVDTKHGFLGKSILELGIRNAFNCLILAINRGKERIKNPGIHFVFQEHDVVYIFGTKSSLKNLKNFQGKLK